MRNWGHAEVVPWLPMSIVDIYICFSLGTSESIFKYKYSGKGVGFTGGQMCVHTMMLVGDCVETGNQIVNHMSQQVWLQ